jgi:KDO2-lipid IV(A) lauroyltransferase
MRVARESFEALAAALFEWFVLTRRGPAAAARCVRQVEGWDHVRAALAAGRGLIIVTPHFGLFELMPVAFLQWGVSGKVVGRKPDDEGFESLLTAVRLQMGVETLYQKQAREMLRTLTRNECLGILPDQDIDKLPGIFVPFFGREAYTATGPASLAVTTGAPILPAFLHRVGPGNHRLQVRPPVPDPGGDREERIRALTLGWCREFEQAIAADPRQWAWVHRRWQTTPESLARRRARRARRDAAG